MALTAYTRSTWKSGDILTATRLNNIESQVMNLTKVFVAENDSDRYVASKNAWGTVKIANNNNFSISNGVLDLVASPSFTNITASGTASMATLSASGDATIGGSLTVTNKMSVGMTITFAVAATASNTFTATGLATLNGGLNTTNASLSGTLGVTGVTTLQAVNANNISVTNGITTNRATLTAALDTYNALDLIPESRLTSYVGSTLGSISITAGDGLTGGGSLSVTRTLSLAPASTSSIGGIKVGANLSISNDGILSGNYAAASTSAAGLMSASDKTKLDGLSTVASSGSYEDLVDAPTALSAFSNDVPYVTSNEISRKVDMPYAAGTYCLQVTEDENNNFSSVWTEMPPLPSFNGTYQLQVTMNNDIPTYSWIRTGGE